MDRELVEAFVLEYKMHQEWEERWKANHIDFDNYFKYSGKVETNKVLISHWRYDENKGCNDLCEHYIKTEEYDKLWKEKAGKDNPGRFTEEITTYYRGKTKDSLRSDKI